jgi:hypothetical protein
MAAQAKIRGVTMHLGGDVVLAVRPNRMFVVYRLTGERHEHRHMGTTVHSKRVLGRGRVVGDNNLKLMRGTMSVPALREALRASGHDQIRVTR